MGAARTATESPTREPGLILDRFRPLRPLGTGGSGSVWLARDEHAGREVALKVVRREGKAAARAEREVEAAARLRHPRCLRTLALDRDDEHVYVAYEYVRGRTLRDALRAGTLDDRAAVEVCAQILEGLAHAHSRRIVHRDVKPANVMLAEGDELSVRLLDFGLAHVEEAETLTAAGDVPGTLAYVSPERLAGGPATGAADVWAVGVVLWEALAGWHAFTAPSPVETAQRIREGAQPLAELRPDLPAGLCGIVDGMLASDPRRRPAAKRLPDALRDAFAESRRRPRPAASLTALRERALHAALAAVFTTASTLVLPFFPHGWPLLAGALAGLAALRSPRAGLALALAAPVLPLGNVALGLALAYAVAALGWFALFARAPTGGLLFLAGPALAPLGGLALVPFVAQRAADPVRRAATAALATIAAAGFAAVAGGAVPLGARPAALVLGETSRPDVAAGAVAGSLGARPGVLVAAAVLAAATLALPLARRQGLWGAAFWGGGLMTALLLLPLAVGTTVAAPWLVPGIWAGAIWLALPELRRVEESPGGRSPAPAPAPGH
jgi:Ser/Thr protein kinase RdoA (MazF antagonist)